MHTIFVFRFFFISPETKSRNGTKTQKYTLLDVIFFGGSFSRKISPVFSTSISDFICLRFDSELKIKLPNTNRHFQFEYPVHYELLFCLCGFVGKWCVTNSQRKKMYRKSRWSVWRLCLQNERVVKLKCSRNKRTNDNSRKKLVQHWENSEKRQMMTKVYVLKLGWFAHYNWDASGSTIWQFGIYVIYIFRSYDCRYDGSYILRSYILTCFQQISKWLIWPFQVDAWLIGTITFRREMDNLIAMSSNLSWSFAASGSDSGERWR